MAYLIAKFVGALRPTQFLVPLWRPGLGHITTSDKVVRRRRCHLCCGAGGSGPRVFFKDGSASCNERLQVPPGSCGRNRWSSAMYINRVIWMSAPASCLSARRWSCPARAPRGASSCPARACAASSVAPPRDQHPGGASAQRVSCCPLRVLLHVLWFHHWFILAGPPLAYLL